MKRLVVVVEIRGEREQHTEKELDQAKPTNRQPWCWSVTESHPRHPNQPTKQPNK